MKEAMTKTGNTCTIQAFLQIFFNKNILLLAFLSISMFSGFSQKAPATPLNPQNVVNPVDLIGIVGKVFNKKGPARTDVLIPGVSNTSLLPIIGYGPANGFVIGA